MEHPSELIYRDKERKRERGEWTDRRSSWRSLEAAIGFVGVGLRTGSDGR
jgi:hypothetical protein